jgi:hypothetical protein
MCADHGSRLAVDAGGQLSVAVVNRDGLPTAVGVGAAGQVLWRKELDAVHEGLTLLESGIGFRGGGGLKYPLVMQRRGRIKGAGIRADAALIVMTSGLAAESGGTRQATASGSLYLSF